MTLATLLLLTAAWAQSPWGDTTSDTQGTETQGTETQDTSADTPSWPPPAPPVTPPPATPEPIVTRPIVTRPASTPIPQPSPVTLPSPWARPSTAPLQPTQVQAGMIIKVADRASAVQSIVDDAQGIGGWFSSLSDEAVVVRVPVAQVRPMLDRAANLGVVIDRNYDSTDLSAELIDLHSRLKAREDVLEKYLQVLETASPKAVITVEHEVSRSVSEIEQIKGRLHFLEDRARYAQIGFSFQFRDRKAPVRDGSSSFAWLNTMNVSDLQAAFQGGWRARRSVAHPVAPEGFAVWSRHSHFQAVSPDDVVFRVRSAKNKPTADLAFWREALRSRMIDSGYVLVNDENISASGVDGALIELGAAAGETDQTYIIGLFVWGERLVIVEATGEAQAFTARRDAVVEAIRKMSW